MGIISNSPPERSVAAVTTMPFYFRHFYDSMTFSSHYNSINSAVSFVNQVYMYNFPASAISTPDYPIAVDSITSLRHCQADIDTPCNSTQGCGGFTSHHRDIGSIANSLNAWRTRTYGTDNENMGQIVVLWTDYEEGAYCYYHYDEDRDAYVHEECSYLAVVYDHRPVIHIMDIATSNSNHKIAHMGILLAHELVHCIGLDDVYDDDSPNHLSDGTMTCMMDYFVDQRIQNGSIVYPALEFRNRIVANYETAFCDVCAVSIENLLFEWIETYNYYFD